MRDFPQSLPLGGRWPEGLDEGVFPYKAFPPKGGRWLAEGQTDEGAIVERFFV